MKIVRLAVVGGLTVIAAVLPAPAAVTFTNSPVAVSNTYPGVITLQIAGLTNTEKVVVQKYLDLNTNGVINPTDWLVQQFTLQDGASSVIGGVTNFNVPGDWNAATGAITATLGFQSGEILQNLVGKSLFKLSSPTGRFAPITNSLTVTNFPFPQQFTGTVVSNKTATVVSNAVVLFFPPPRPGDNGPSGSPLGGVVANNAGAYTAALSPGTYQLVSFRSNFVANLNTAPVLTLTNSQLLATNLMLTNASAGISGSVVDAANSSLGLPAVMVPAISSGGLISVTTTDTNGNFTVRVTTGTWGVQVDDLTLISHGYVGLQNGTNVSSGKTGLKFAVPRATALIYGRVQDGFGNPLAGVDIYANDQNNNVYQTDAYTDAGGNYVLGALGLGGADPWWLQADSDNRLTNYIFSQTTIDGSLSDGQAVLQDFSALLATARITGSVKDSRGTNIVGVGVNANAAINGIYYQAYFPSDANGNYVLNVAPGEWSVSVNCSYGSDSLDALLGSGSYACPDSQIVNLAAGNLTNNIIVQLCGGIVILTPAPLPVGEVNVPYYQGLSASSCNGSFNWSVLSGTLPPGLSLNPASGEVSGTPAGAGIYSVTAQVADGSSLTTNRVFSLAISNAVQITTTTLPAGTNGANYSQSLSATAGVPFGGASPYRWTLASGTLPDNLSLSTNGLLAGSINASGTFNFTVEAADRLGGLSDQLLSLTVGTTNRPPLAIGSGSGQVFVFWPAAAGTNFLVQMTTNLATGPWVPVTNAVPQIGFTITNTGPAAYFRLQ